MPSKSIRIALAALVTAAVTGCASVPLTPLDADNAAKTYAVQPDKANIYLYRNENFAGAVTMPVMLNGKLMGRTAPKTYFLWEVPPGAHEIASIGESTATLKLNTLPGRNYFVWQEMKMGMWAPRSILQEVDESTGKAGVAESRRIDPSSSQ